MPTELPTTTTTATAVRRSVPVDIARGLAILFVVVLHVGVGLSAAGLIGPEHPVAQVNEVLYLFRMPALALLIGLFVAPGVRRRGSAGYLAERTAELLYLYVVWSLVLGLIGIATSGLQNSPTDPSVLWRLWTPQDHLWFLPFMVVMTAFLVGLRPWQSRARLVLGLTAAAVVSALTWRHNYDVAGFDGLSLLLFGAVGASLTLRRLSDLLERSLRWWSVVLVAAAGVFVTVLQLGPVSGVAGDQGAPPGLTAISMLSGLAGVVVLVAVSRFLAEVPSVGAALAYVGRRTITLYLVHLLFTASMRIALLQLGVTDVTIHVVLGLVVGIGAPLVIGEVVARREIPGVFALPPALRGSIRQRMTMRGGAIPARRPA